MAPASSSTSAPVKSAPDHPVNHRSRHRQKQREAQQQQQAAAAPASSRVPQVFDMSSFDAATYSTNRGYIPSYCTESSEELTGHALRRIRGHSRWLYNNTGYARVINILANLIGYQQVQPATADKKWNRLAKDHWRNRTKSPATFDRTGKYNHALWQLQLNRARLKDGDILTVLLEASTGAAQFLFYEANQIDDPRTGQKPDTIQDGVVRDKFGKHIAYRIANSDDDTGTRISTADGFLFADFERPGQIRGYPALAHAINDLIDLTEIDTDNKLGIKRRLFVGLYKKRAAAGQLPGATYASVGQEATGTTTTGPDGLTKNVMVNVEKVFDGTGIGGLQAGEEYATVESDQPGPNEAEFNKRILHKIAMGLGLTGNIIFSILGAGGPEVRFQMEILRRWLEVEMLRLLTANQTIYYYWLIKEIARGALPYPDDDQYWKALYIPQADPTIDKGKEGRLQLEQLRVGAETFPHIWETAGEDFESQMEAQVEAISFASAAAAAKGLKLTDIMPGWNEGQVLANNFHEPPPPPQE